MNRKYEVKTTNLNDLLEKSAEIFSRTHKEISVSREFEKNLWPVEVDRGQIDQVLLNLYINAWQAMPVGGGSAYCNHASVNTSWKEGFSPLFSWKKWRKDSAITTGNTSPERQRPLIRKTCPAYEYSCSDTASGAGVKTEK